MRNNELNPRDKAKQLLDECLKANNNTAFRMLREEIRNNIIRDNTILTAKNLRDNAPKEKKDYFTLVIENIKQIM